LKAEASKSANVDGKDTMEIMQKRSKQIMDFQDQVNKADTGSTSVAEVLNSSISFGP
jgi:hypothetical protein